jgi:hypothetical protein
MKYRSFYPPPSGAGQSRGTEISRRRQLYERIGFEVVEEYRFADDAPPVWRIGPVPR